MSISMQKNQELEQIREMITYLLMNIRENIHEEKSVASQEKMASTTLKLANLLLKITPFQDDKEEKPLNEEDVIIMKKYLDRINQKF